MGLTPNSVYVLLKKFESMGRPAAVAAVCGGPAAACSQRGRGGVHSPPRTGGQERCCRWPQHAWWWQMVLAGQRYSQSPPQWGPASLSTWQSACMRGEVWARGPCRFEVDGSPARQTGTHYLCTEGETLGTATGALYVSMYCEAAAWWCTYRIKSLWRKLERPQQCGYRRKICTAVVVCLGRAHTDWCSPTASFSRSCASRLILPTRTPASDLDRVRALGSHPQPAACTAQPPRAGTRSAR